MTETATELEAAGKVSGVQGIIDAYQTWTQTLVSYMARATGLLENLYVEQEQVIDELRKLCARTHSLRHADFDVILGKVLGDRGKTRQSLMSLVNGYRAERETVIAQLREMFRSGMDQASRDWPALKQRLLGGEEGVQQIVQALREVHMEQQKISAALSGLLGRGEMLKIDDLKTVVQTLASRDSRTSAELAALLAICESAGRNAGLKWQCLAA
ncbi:MAG: hypothetical protein ABR964_06035 [Tepidisphaeraceae bacterium]|jgi:predicted RNA-binding protein YlqC (UPF0109 family)